MRIAVPATPRARQRRATPSPSFRAGKSTAIKQQQQQANQKTKAKIQMRKMKKYRRETLEVHTVAGGTVAITLVFIDQ